MKILNKLILTIGLIFLCIFQLHAQEIGSMQSAQTEKAEKAQFSIGIGGIYYRSPFENESGKFIPLPNINFDNGTFYINANEIGYHLRKPMREGVFIDLIGKIQTTAGIDHSLVNFDLGLKFGYFNKHIYFSLLAVQDVSFQHKGQRILATIAKPISIDHDKWSITPSISAEWLSKRAIDYTYGINQKKQQKMIDKNRENILPIYNILSSDVNFIANINATYKLNNRWSFTVTTGASYLGKKIRSNPSITTNFEYYGGSWVNYSF